MLKKLFKWIYFLLSGVSFILIIMLIAFSGYLYIAENEVKSLVNDFQDYRIYKKNDNLFEVVDIDQDVSMMMSMNSKSSNDNPRNESDPKIKIQIRDGIAYLRPSQILYIESGSDYHVLTAINGRQLELNKRETPLKKIGAELNEYLCFISLKSYVINCNYIEQVKRISDGRYSRTHVIMEDERKIPIPEKSIQDVLEILEQINE